MTENIEEKKDVLEMPEVFNEKYIDQTCKNPDCLKTRGYDKNWKVWVKGYCSTCYQRLKRVKQPPRLANENKIKPEPEKKIRKRRGTKFKKLQFNANAEENIFEPIASCLETLGKAIVEINKTVIKNKGMESAERLKLYNRIKSVEAFVSDSTM
ncbi:MAG TPA: hypothetical protein PKY81_10850 [bacterium]|nr:hypothetical protein [bacterium]HPN31447.1 hypothetical protein [bacterium]